VDISVKYRLLETKMPRNWTK